jgi:hypothetical protein
MPRGGEPGECMSGTEAEVSLRMPGYAERTRRATTQPEEALAYPPIERQCRC